MVGKGQHQVHMGMTTGTFLGEEAVGVATSSLLGVMGRWLCSWVIKAQKPREGVLAIWLEVKTSGLPSVRVSSPGSSLTVFFVDLHQGLVGLLCSCQTVLRLGREAAKSGHGQLWLYSPSINRHPETQTCAANM